MPRRARSHLRIAVIVACAAIAVAVASSGAVAASAHRKPAHDLVCSKVLPAGEIESAIRTETGIAPEVKPIPVYTSKYSEWADAPNGLRGPKIPTSGCFTDWSPGDGNASTYDPDVNGSTFLGPNLIVWVGTNATPREWNNIEANEQQEPGTATDAIADYSFNPQRRLSLGDGSKGFIVSFTLPAPDKNPYNTTDYGLYVYSKHHNLLTFWAWPLSLKGEEQIVGKLLSHNVL